MVAEPTNRPEPRYGSATIPKLLMGAGANHPCSGPPWIWNIAELFVAVDQIVDRFHLRRGRGGLQSGRRHPPEAGWYALDRVRLQHDRRVRYGTLTTE